MAFPPLLTLILLPVLVQDTVARRADFDERFPIELTGELSDDADGSALMEALDWRQLHPYDLNSITLEELLSIPCVTLSGAQAVLAFRADGGTFRFPDQLLTIGGGGERLYRALIPFVCAGGKSSCGSARRRVLFRARGIEDSPSDPSTPGSPLLSPGTRRSGDLDASPNFWPAITNWSQARGSSSGGVPPQSEIPGVFAPGTGWR